MSSLIAKLESPVYKQPLPAIVDQVARETPDKTFLTIAKSTGSTEGARTINYSEAARAIDRAAVWLDQTLGKADGFPAYAFMANNFDARYILFTMASIKTGHRYFLPSPRNSEEFHLHLLNKLQIKTIVSSIAVGPYADKANCTVIEPPSLDSLLADGDFQSYPYTKTLEEALNDPICVLHSSGSTGPPKPITWTNGYIEAGRKISMSAKSGEGMMLGSFAGEHALGMLAMPLFHTAGLLSALNAIVLYGTPMVSFPAAGLVNAESAIEFIKTFKPNRGMLAPSVLEDIAKDDELVKSLRLLPVTIFGGAAIGEKSGEKISEYTNLISGIGSTEAHMYPLLMPANGIKGYSWLHLEPLDGFTFREQADGLSELVIERSNVTDWPVFHVFPEIKEYATNDLYEKHPSAPNAWKMVGRKDDVLVLSNGEKAVPAPMESMLRTSPDVTGALYFGHGKFTVGALIELTEAASKFSEEEMLDRIKPFAKKANDVAPAFARLSREMTLFVSPEKLMRRAPKGSVIRKATLADYAEEIEAAYLREDSASAVELVKNLSEEDTQQALLNILERLTGKKISVQEDLFQSVGADSLQAISVTRTIKASVQAEAPQYANKVTSALVYNNPTIKQLAVAVRSLVETGNPNVSTRDATAEIQAMLDKYSEGIPEAVPVSLNADGKYNVILTGSTGSLGSYMLSLLINDPAVGKIYALNRTDDSLSRQQASNSSRELSTDMSKVVFLKASLGNKNLGLPPQTYQELVTSTNLIIHNAWPVNFNQSLESFEPHIRGVRNFIDLAAASPLRPHIVFISSVGTTSAWEAYYPGQPRPEARIDDSRPAQGAGYGEGKWVGEHLLANAAASGISSTIARVGQVAGPVESLKGKWNVQEWLPSIIFSSAHMGKLPTSLGAAPTNWIPVDAMAKTVVELGFHDLSARTADAKVGDSNTYNLTNPADNGWTSLVDGIVSRIPAIKTTVPWSEWVEQVQADSENNDTDATQHPAVKLIGFYSTMDSAEAGTYATDKAVAASKAMASVHAVNNEWMNIWLTQWGF